MADEKQKEQMHQREQTKAEPPKNRIDALKQRHDDTEDRLGEEAEVRKQQAEEAEQRRDAALEREKELRNY
jgi:hypothetical protein